MISDHATQSVPEKPKQVGKKRRGAISECIYLLKGLLHQFNHLAADLVTRVSFATSRSRSVILLQAFKVLHEKGMHIRRPHNFCPKHMQVLVDHWVSQKLSASTLQLRFSIFRVFCVWISKHGMLRDINDFLIDPSVAKRTGVTRTDKSWTGKGVNVREKIEEVFMRDRHVGVQLLVSWAFMLRPEEAMKLKPHLADQGAYLVADAGTKGGRPRPVTIRHDWQRNVLEFAKSYANQTTGSLIPDEYKYVSWRNHFYKICEECGISRKHGIVPHGLRHEGANDLYKELTGADSPARGGTEIVDKWLDHVARIKVAQTLGHARKQVTGAYLGPIIRAKIKEGSGDSVGE